MIDNDQRHPVGGVGYPRSPQESDEWFSSEEACAAFVRRVPWPEGFQCRQLVGYQRERDYKI